MRLLVLLLFVLVATVVSAQKMPEVVTYDLKCRLFPAEKRFEIDCELRLPPGYPKGEKIEFTLGEKMSKPSVTIAGRAVDATAGNVVDGDRKWTVAAPTTSHPILISYRNEAAQANVFNLGPEGCFAGGPNSAWYPKFGEYRAEGKMSFDAPTGWVVVATGKRIGNENRFEADQPSHLTFAAAPYKVRRIEGGVPMTLYLLKDRPDADVFVQGCWKTLAYLETLFGRYPFPEFALIETPSPQSNQTGFSGASFEGFIFSSSDELDNGYNLAYIAHEIGHSWWGNLVTRTGNGARYMMDEAIVQYGSVRAVEKFDGPALATRYRWRGYPGYSQIQNLYGSLLLQAGGFDKPLGHLSDVDSRTDHAYANAKGFLAWHSIARLIGFDRFHKALQRVTKKYAWRSITFEQFLAEIRKEAGADSDRIFEQWFERKGIPVLSSRFEQTGSKLGVTIEQSGEPYILRVPVRVDYDNGSSDMRDILIRERSQTFQVPARRRVVGVVVDPQRELYQASPDLVAETKALAFYGKAYIAAHAGDYPTAQTILEEGLKSIPTPDPYGVEYNLRSFLGSAYRRAGKHEEAKKQYELSLLLANRDEGNVPWTYFRLAQVLRALGDEEGAKGAINQAISAEARLQFPSGVRREIERFLERG